MQDLTGYISFSDAQKRYEIKQSALSYRIKSLGLKTKRQGRNTFLSLKHISLLDDLNKFLKENPTKTIDEFLSQPQVNLQSITDELAIPQALETDELSAKPPTADASLINHCITDESLISPNLPQIKSSITHIFKAFSGIEGTDDFTNQSLINQATQAQDAAKDREIANLKEEILKLKKEKEESNQNIQKWQETAITAINLYHQLAKELNSQKNECNNWENLWSELVPHESIHSIFCKVGERVYLKTNYLDYNYAKSILLKILSLLNRQN